MSVYNVVRSYSCLFTKVVNRPLKYRILLYIFDSKMVRPVLNRYGTGFVPYLISVAVLALRLCMIYLAMHLPAALVLKIAVVFCTSRPP